MGQRLVVEVVGYNDKGEQERLATAYYHWSGYTTSSCEVTQKILDDYEEFYDDEDPIYEDHHKNNLYTAIKILEGTGAGILEDDYGKILEIFPDLSKDDFKECTSRNDGIIDFTEEGMEDSLGWAEALVTIDIDNHSVNFDAYVPQYIEDYYNDNIVWCMRSYENGEEDHKDEDIKKINEYYKDHLINKENRDEAVRLVEEENKKSYFREPMRFDNLFFDDIAFEDFHYVKAAFEEVYRADSFELIVNDNPETVICMIE